MQIMTIKKASKILLPVSMVFLISSCDLFDNKNVTQICKENPELCQNFQSISQCRYKRTSLIRTQYRNKLEPTEKNKIELLDELAGYEQCLERTLRMRLNHDKKRKVGNMHNYFATQALTKKILADSKNTQDPHLAYYLWINHQDLDAKKVFFDAVTHKDTHDVDLLIKAATIYAGNNPQKSLDSFYKALRYSHSFKEFPTSTFTLIMTIYYQNKLFERAYVFALLADKVSDDDELPINLDLILRKGLPHGEQLIKNTDKLEKIADSYYDALKQGNFKERAPELSEE